MRFIILAIALLMACYETKAEKVYIVSRDDYESLQFTSYYYERVRNAFNNGNNFEDSLRYDVETGLCMFCRLEVFLNPGDFIVNLKLIDIDSSDYKIALFEFLKVNENSVPELNFSHAEIYDKTNIEKVAFDFYMALSIELNYYKKFDNADEQY